MDKLLKSKKRMLAFIMSFIISLSFVGCKSNKRNNVEVSSEFINETVSSEADSIDNVRYLSEMELEKFWSPLMDIQNNYEYEVDYQTSSAVDYIKKSLESLAECQNTVVINNFDLVNIIVKNSIEKANIDEAIFLDVDNATKYTNSQIKRINEVEPIFYECLCRAINNIDDDNSHALEDICKIKNIYIKLGNLEDGVLGEYYDKEESITIDYNQALESFEAQKAEKLEAGEEPITIEQYFTNLLQHELNHVRQYACSCRKDAGQINDTIGIYGFISNIESSAESQIYNYSYLYKSTDCYDYTYLEERRTESLLLLMAVFKENRTLDGYYEAIFNSNMQDFFNYFGIHNEQELCDFYKIAFTIDTLNGRTLLSKKIIDSGYNTNGLFENEVGYTYKLDMFKYVIKDLIIAINRDSLTLDQSIALYDFVKSYISDSYELKEENGEYLYLYDDEFIRNFIKVESVFYNFLSTYFGISEEELENLTNNSERVSMLTRVLDNEPIFVDVYDSVRKLLYKYPMLKNINWANYVSLYDLGKLNERLEKEEMVRLLK